MEILALKGSKICSHQLGTVTIWQLSAGMRMLMSVILNKLAFCRFRVSNQPPLLPQTPWVLCENWRLDRRRISERSKFMTAMLMSWLPSNNRVWSGSEILTPPHAAVLYRCWSSGSPSRARAAPLRPACQPQLSPTAPPSQPTTSTGPRSQTQPPRPWPWLNQIPMTFMRSPELSMRVGVSTRADTAGVVTRRVDSPLEGGVVKIYHCFCFSHKQKNNCFVVHFCCFFIWARPLLIELKDLPLNHSSPC